MSQSPTPVSAPQGPAAACQSAKCGGMFMKVVAPTFVVGLVLGLFGGAFLGPIVDTLSNRSGETKQTNATKGTPRNAMVAPDERNEGKTPPTTPAPSATTSAEDNKGGGAPPKP